MWHLSWEEKYGFSLNVRVNFAGKQHFVDALIDETIPAKELLDNESYSKIFCCFAGTVYDDEILVLRKNFFYDAVSLGNSSCNLLKLMNNLVFVMKYLLISYLFLILLHFSKQLSSQMACHKYCVPEVNQPAKTHQDQ